MYDVALVEVIDGVQDLSNRLGSVLFRELALFADAVKQLSASRQLGHDIVLVLHSSREPKRIAGVAMEARTLDSNQS